MVTYSDVYRALDRITPLSFAIVGKSLDGGEPWAAGSGVFVAPYLGLTAKHVVEGTWNRFEPEWQRHRFPKQETRATHFLVLSQKLYIDRGIEATWTIEETIPIPYTDLILLRISPQNDVARTYQWGAGFFDLQLLPPSPEADVWLFGYPECEAENDDARNVITGDFKLEIEKVRVTAVEEFRRDGLKDFPGFEITPGVKGGGSGGPVVVDNRLCGIASVGWDGEHTSVGYVAALWPMIFATVDFRLGEKITMLELLRTGTLFRRPVDLDEVEQRAYLAEYADGSLSVPRKYARLRPKT